ncbi:MAG: 3-phosphoserine/phosphohydroxythreonine transaminase [Planctomycetota bacterium]
MERAHNFFAGPAVLPVEVLKSSAQAVLDFGQGMGLIEMSHRSKEFDKVINDAVANMRDVMEIPENYKILFMTGGASTQFALVPMNFLKGSADYIDTGSWSSKAIKEAKLFGNVNVVFSGKADAYRQIPAEFKTNPDADYLHVTSNNTIYGTQFQKFPDSGKVPMICDMSSDIMCRRVDISQFAMIYAGAQKNMGPAGVTIAIVRDDLLAKVPETLPTMFKYTTYSEENSLYNTPPVFPIYVVGEVLKWLKGLGGIDAIEKINRHKAGLIYEVLDKYPCYKPHAASDSRSLMNITWTMETPELEAALLEEAKKRRMFGLKGHRSVGGLRASIYNACPVESCEALRDLLVEFAEKL